MMWWYVKHTLVHDLGKFVRSSLDLDSHSFKAQGVLGTWDFTFNIYVKDNFNFKSMMY